MKNSKLFIVILSAILGFASCADRENRWQVGRQTVNSSTFEIRSDQSAFYAGSISRGIFKNFTFNAHITHSEGAIASLWIHSDRNFSKGYSILIGNPANDRRRSGSLASVRNLYRPVGASFDLEVKVEGMRITVKIDGVTVVDYLEPEIPYRTLDNAAQLLSKGLIGFHVEKGTLKIENASITPYADDLPNYPDGMGAYDEQADELIRLQQRNFPVVDYHVHIPRGMSLEDLHTKSLEEGIEFGIAINCGIGFQIQTDEAAKEFINANRHYPFWFAMQGEGREWVETFTKETRELFDYVLTDHLTFHDHKGRRTRLWVNNEVIIDIPAQEYMDMIVDRTIKMLNEEPIHIWANPTLLGNAMMEDYDKFWTDERVAQVIKALLDNDIALEINARYRLPTARIIRAAKSAGVKFALGTNNSNVQQLDRLAYPIQMIHECGLTIDDMWFPN